MKSSLTSFLFLALFFSLNLLSAEASFQQNFSPIKIIPKGIYGEDDRLDVYQSSDSLMKELARSTAAQISSDSLIQKGDIFTIMGTTLTERGICSTERFADQFADAGCSGFLVSPDTIVTAGHCVESVIECEASYWVFDFVETVEEKSNFTFNKDQVFRCTEIIARERNSVTLNDFAILKLDRPVPGRAPLKYRTTGKPADDAVFTVIGHPSGLPTKITSNAKMRDNTNPIFFKTNSDTYFGNSGSPVIDSKTGIVEGILVRGDQDYTPAADYSCSVSVYYGQDEGQGEDATRITNIKDFLEH